MNRFTAPLLVLAFTALIFLVYPWDGHRAFSQDKKPGKGENRQKANPRQPQGKGPGKAQGGRQKKAGSGNSKAVKKATPRKQGEGGNRKKPLQKGEAARKGRVQGKASSAGKKKTLPKPKSRLKFQPVVKIGPPIFSNCTARCHVNFPFSITGDFRHSYHAPEDGF